MEKCKYCFNEFKKTHGSQLYCNTLCRRHRYERITEKICRGCGKKYGGTKGRFFCSQSCSAKNRGEFLHQLHLRNRKYPKIEGLSRLQIFRKFNPEKQRMELEKDVLRRGLLIQALGGKCVKCGYDMDLRALQLDHINNDGKDDRRRIGSKIHRYYLKNLEEAARVIQILCANCHAIKSWEYQRCRKK